MFTRNRANIDSKACRNQAQLTHEGKPAAGIAKKLAPHRDAIRRHNFMSRSRTLYTKKYLLEVGRACGNIV